MKRLSAACRLAALALLTALAACAPLPSAKAPAQAEAQPTRTFWQGRLALQVASEPPQSYAAGFTLNGDARAGALSFTSPLGNTLAVLHWQPGQAWLEQGGQTQFYESLEQLSAQATGAAALPLEALLGWLRGQPHEAPGWQADLGRVAQGRLTARRVQPLPAAELRLVFEP
ncbi:MAG: lipoprotein insertase outer membrane protein LolB [Comamonadaceae bacterium]|nr:lipoprotein insertase outer membrane protein LolB [Comamonadaceae bacterium]